VLATAAVITQGRTADQPASISRLSPTHVRSLLTLHFSCHCFIFTCSVICSLWCIVFDILLLESLCSVQLLCSHVADVFSHSVN